MLHAMTQRFRLRWVMHAFPVLNKIIPALGPLVVRINPVSKALINFRRHIITQIDEILRDPGSLVTAKHETVYHHLMTPRSTKGPIDIPSRASLIDEAINLVIAGSDTVGGTSTVGIFHVLSNPQIHATLIKELKSAWPDTSAKVGYEILEKLPYLVRFALLICTA
jgi:cytochrome P450